MSFLNSVINNSKKFEKPFIHWELNKPLSDGALKEITKDMKMVAEGVSTVKSAYELIRKFNIQASIMQETDT